MSVPERPSARELLRRLVTVRSDPGRNREALVIVAPIAASLVVMSLIHGPEHGAAGMMGAMAALAGSNNAPRTRARMLAGTGAATIVSQFLGLLTVPVPWLFPLVMAAWTLLVVWVWHALELGPPGPLNTLFAAAFGAFMGTHGWRMTTVLTLTLPAFLIAAAGSMLIILVSPYRPVRTAVASAEEAVEEYCQPPEDATAHDLARLRSQAHAAVHHAWWVFNDGHTSGASNPRATSELADLRARLLNAHMALEIQLRKEAFPSANLSLPDALERTPLGRPRASYLLRTAAERGSRPIMVALRAATGVFVAALLMLFLPFGHPYWAVLSVLIVLHMDANRTDMTIKAIHRVLGTALGLVIYLLVSMAGPTGWVQVALIILSLWAMQCLVRRHYGLACIFITCFALFMTPLTQPGEMWMLASDRIRETIVGLSVGIATIYVVGRRAPVLLVRSQYRRTLRSMMPVLRSLATGTTETPDALLRRNELVHELVRGSGVLSATRPDAPQALQEWSAVDRRVTETGYDLLAVCWHATGRKVPWAPHVLTEITLFITSLPPISSQNLDALEVARQIERIRVEMVTSLPGSP